MTIAENVPVTAESAPLRIAQPPRAAAAASRVAVVLAVGVLGVGAVAVRDAAVTVNWLHGESWLPRALDALDGLTTAVWTLPIGVAATVAGLLLVVVSLLPRRVTAMALGDGVYIGRDDVAKVATAAALDVPGVVKARSTVGRRKVTVRCQVTGDTAVRILVIEAVTAELVPLRHAPRVLVRARKEVCS